MTRAKTTFVKNDNSRTGHSKMPHSQYNKAQTSHSQNATPQTTFSKESTTQISDTLFLNLLLALSGGLQDAYTYIVRDHVFANAQTGNIVLMSTHFIAGEFQKGAKYAIPVLFFALGIFLSQTINNHFKNSQKLHWRQGVVLLEVVVLFCAAFVPARLNFLANALVSFSCAMQIQAFRKVNGVPYASTMCIGNLRSATESLALFFHTKQKKYKVHFFYYAAVIFVFALGSAIGGVLSTLLKNFALWGSCAILLICFFAMGEKGFSKR